MKKHLSLFRIRLITGLQYRTVVLGAVLTRFAWGFMEVLAFTAIYRSGDGGFPMELRQTVSYLWMQEALHVLFSVVYSDGEIYESILSGSIACELLRPMSLYGRWFCQSSANRLAPTALVFLPVLAAAALLPEPYGLSLLPNAAQCGLFLVSAVLALGVVVAFAMLLYISLFYTLSHRGIKIIAAALTTFLSGGVIPLPYFPAPVLAVVRLLPFAAMQSMPLLIYSGSLSGADALRGLVSQVFWLAVLVLLGEFLMDRTLRRVTVHGG